MIDRLRPLWDELKKAVLSDPSYVIEFARAGSAVVKDSTPPTLKIPELSGV